MPDLAAVLEALGASVVDLAGHGSPCPACGVTTEELAEVRRKRRLDAALAACEHHRRTCRDPRCSPVSLRGCDTFEELRERYFEAWKAYHGQTGTWDPTEDVVLCRR